MVWNSFLDKYIHLYTLRIFIQILFIFCWIYSGKLWILFSGKQDEYYRYDVGLIFLKQDAILNEKVKLASLPDSNQDCPPGNNLIASGWGADPFILNFNVHILRAVKQGCVDIEKCTIIKPQYRDLALCVGDEKDFRNTIWRGDSGGKVF